MWDEPPDDDWWAKWVLGTGVPVIIASIGLYCMATGYVSIPARRGWLILRDGDATIFGWAVIALAVAVHAHYLWYNIERLAPFAELAKGAALVGVVVAMFAVIFRVMV